MEHFSPVLVTSDRCVVPGADGAEFCVSCARHQALELGQAGHHEEQIVADKPRHCDDCGMLLEVVLSPAGIAYIESALQTVIDAQDFDPAIADGEVLAGWRTQYSDLLDDEIKAGFESMWGGTSELKTRLDDDTVVEQMAAALEDCIDAMRSTARTYDQEIGIGQAALDAYRKAK
jgi:hypothetical protein